MLLIITDWVGNNPDSWHYFQHWAFQLSPAALANAFTIVANGSCTKGLKHLQQVICERMGISDTCRSINIWGFLFI